MRDYLLKIMKIKKEKCDYCEEEAKFNQTFFVSELDSNGEEIIWQRFACKTHREHSED